MISESVVHRPIGFAGVDGRAPRLCFLATASGDDSGVLRNFYDAAQSRGLIASHLAQFTMPNVEDTLPAGYASDDDGGLLYRDAEFVEAFTEQDRKAVYWVERGTGDRAVETRIDPRRF